MPSPEHGPGGPPDQPQRQEHEPLPYQRVARFADADVAGQVYAHAQDADFGGPPADLSVYRFLLDTVSHVAVLGAPPAALDSQLIAILAVGEPATLPPTVLQALTVRRQQQRRHGSWVEGHYR